MENTNRTTEAARQARNAYMRAWRKANPERVKAINERYWLKRAQQSETKAEAEQRSNAQEG